MSTQPPFESLFLMNPEPAWHLLDRYFSEECTLDESAFVDRWVAEHEGNAQLLAHLRIVWAEAGTPRPAVDDDAAWAALRSRIGPQRITAPSSVSRAGLESGRPLWRRWRAVAAAAAIVAAAGAGLVVQEIGRKTDVAAAREFATARGQRAELMLIDGTRVWLGMESRLEVPQGFGTAHRDLHLVGQAYFVVQDGASHAFRVHTPGATTEDLGTAFSVRAYPDDADAAVVVVTDGRVALRTDAARAARGVQLTEGQMGRLDRAGEVHVDVDVDVAAALGWRDGRLEFDERPLAGVIRELQRWYDLEITLDDSVLAQERVVASLTNMTADQALQTVAEALGLQYIRVDRQVRFTSPSLR